MIIHVNSHLLITWTSLISALAKHSSAKSLQLRGRFVSVQQNSLLSKIKFLSSAELFAENTFLQLRKFFQHWRCLIAQYWNMWYSALTFFSKLNFFSWKFSALTSNLKTQNFSHEDLQLRQNLQSSVAKSSTITDEDLIWSLSWEASSHQWDISSAKWVLPCSKFLSFSRHVKSTTSLLKSFSAHMIEEKHFWFGQHPMWAEETWASDLLMSALTSHEELWDSSGSLLINLTPLIKF